MRKTMEEMNGPTEEYVTSVPKSFKIHLRRTKSLHDSNYIWSTPNPASTPTPAL